jgi:hypothetical protein
MFVELLVSKKVIRRARRKKERGKTDPIDFMKPVHVQLTNKTRELEEMISDYRHIR